MTIDRSDYKVLNGLVRKQIKQYELHGLGWLGSKPTAHYNKLLSIKAKLDDQILSMEVKK